MTDERIAVLEQQIQNLTDQLTRQAASRDRLPRLAVILCGCAALMAALGLFSGTSSSASAVAGFTVKAPFKVTGANGATILQVDDHGLTYFAGVGGTVSLETSNNLPAVVIHHGVNGPIVVAIGDSHNGGGGALNLFPDSGSASVGVSMVTNETTGSVGILAQGGKATLRAGDNSPMALQFNMGNVEALGMGVAPDSKAGTITVHDGQGHASLNLGVSSNGGFLSGDNSGGSNAAVLGVGGTGGGDLDIYGGGTLPVAQLAAHPQGGYLRAPS